MAELADALDLGSSVHRRAGSSPVTRTIKIDNTLVLSIFINGFTQSHMNNVGQTTTRYAGVHKKLYKKITFHSTIRLLKSIVKKER